MIIRTAGEDKRKAYFVRDLALLLEEWKLIQERIKSQPMASCVYQEPDLIERTVRDFLTEDVDKIVIDDLKKFESIRDSIKRISPRSARKVHFYNEAEPLFDRYNLSPIPISEPKRLRRISYAFFFLKKKNNQLSRLSFSAVLSPYSQTHLPSHETKSNIYVLMSLYK